MHGSLILIAEVKTSSPFGYKSSRNWDELFAIASSHGDMISIHTDPGWGGSMNDIKKARQATSKSILAKVIHATDAEVREALGHGADAVLVAGRLPSEQLLPFCLIEPTSLKQLAEFAQATSEHQRFVWNSRNLEDGSMKSETFSQARLIWGGWLCQASNIRTVNDIEPTADAILVGQNLSTFVTEQ